MNPQRHRLFGLNISSTVPLPELLLTDDEQSADVSIGFGPIPPRDDPEPIGLSVIGRTAVLNIPEAGRYLIADGRQITVDPSPTASERNVRLYLLGSAFGAILHQRGLLPLHANAIDFGDAAVAFMGHSGAGKSTLAGWLHDNGRAILADDVCVVGEDETGTPTVEAGLPRIRLWGDALRASGRVPGDYKMSFDDMDKYDVPIAAVAVRDPLRLAAIYVLQAACADDSGSIERLTGIDAIDALVANTYRGGYIPLMQGVERHLAQCLSLAQRVPVFSVRRRWGLDLLDEEAAKIEAHVRTAIDHEVSNETIRQAASSL